MFRVKCNATGMYLVAFSCGVLSVSLKKEKAKKFEGLGEALLASDMLRELYGAFDWQGVTIPNEEIYGVKHGRS